MTPEGPRNPKVITSEPESAAPQCVFTETLAFTENRRTKAHPMRSLLLCLAALAAPSPCAAFYLPGVAPRDYLPGEKVELKVNKLSSTKTQLVR